jgi:hypothetical protein
VLPWGWRYQYTVRQKKGGGCTRWVGNVKVPAIVEMGGRCSEGRGRVVVVGCGRALIPPSIAQHIGEAANIDTQPEGRTTRITEEEEASASSIGAWAAEAAVTSAQPDEKLRRDVAFAGVVRGAWA